MDKGQDCLKSRGKESLMKKRTKSQCVVKPKLCYFLSTLGPSSKTQMQFVLCLELFGILKNTRIDKGTDSQYCLFFHLFLVIVPLFFLFFSTSNQNHIYHRHSAVSVSALVC